jgi:hypothetical protein
VGESSVWIKGEEIVENELIIFADNINYWSLESSALQMDFMENNYNENMNEKDFRRYLKEYKRYSLDNNLQGCSFNKLLEIKNECPNDLTEYFKLMPLKGNRNQYASTVPHLMLEIKESIIPKSIKKWIL